MKDESRQRLDQDAGDGTGLGDDQGTRVGSSTPAAGKRTGAGAEAVEGLHSADGDRTPDHGTALEGKETGRSSQDAGDLSGSEPIGSHGTEHRSKYGGGSRREDGGGQRSP